MNRHLLYRDVPLHIVGTETECATAEVREHLDKVHWSFVMDRPAPDPMAVVLFEVTDGGVPVRRLIVKESEVHGTIDENLQSISRDMPKHERVRADARSV